MKTSRIIFLSVIAVVLTSCKTPTYFQVYKAAASEKLITKENYMVYEDDNCIVSYNLWDEGGNIGFRFNNKTDENIYLNLEESFFVLNGISYNYYKNRVFTNSTNAGSTTARVATASKAVTGLNYLDLLQTNRIQATSSIGLVTSTGYSISRNEEKIICIPAKTSKIITEYNISESLFRDCDLLRFPKTKQIKSKIFSKEESPIVFSNRIAYSFGQSDNLIKFENEFYITEITNYPESEMVETIFDEYCGEKSMTQTKYFKNIYPNMFYIKYAKGLKSFKH